MTAGDTAAALVGCATNGGEGGETAMVLRMWMEKFAGVTRCWRIMAAAIEGECEVWLEEHRGAWPVPSAEEEWRPVTWEGHVADPMTEQSARAMVIIGRPVRGWERGLRGQLEAAVKRLEEVPGEIERRHAAEPIIEREIKRYVLDRMEGVRDQESGVRSQKNGQVRSPGGLRHKLRMEA